MDFSNTNGLYALLSLIPLIIIYLKRPKPHEMKIPSIMFIMKASGFSKAHTLFRKLIHNLLFMLQLLALVGLSIAAAVPYVDVPTTVVSRHTVIVLDISASMQAEFEGKSRFSEATRIAKERVHGTNSIILAGQNAYIAGSSVSESRAREIIDQVSPTETVTNLGSAILAVETLVNESHTKVVVISDFNPTIGPNPLEAKRVLVSKGFDVEFVDVAKPAKNIGIVDLELSSDRATAFIMNYNDEDAAIDFELHKNSDVVDRTNFTVPANSIETVEFEIIPGKSKIEIKADDDFKVDNVAYISSPAKEKISVMMMTNTLNSNVELALRASPRIALTVQQPPRITNFNFDVFIFSDINTNILLPGTPDDVQRKVRVGASSIIISQPDMQKIKWFGLMPVQLHDYLNESSINIDIFNRFSKYLQAGETGRYSTDNYFNATAPNESIVIASADDESPLIAIKQIGAGKSVFYGVKEQNEFTLSTDYPIFWNNLVNFLVDRGDITDYNKRFTDFYTINITKQGIYNLQGKDISMNLLDQAESNVGLAGLNQSEIIRRDKESFEIEEEKNTVPLSFEKYLILAVLAIFAIEILIVKRRGDL